MKRASRPASGVVDGVLDPAVDGAGEQRLERYVARGARRAQHQHPARLVRRLFDEHALDPVGPLPIRVGFCGTSRADVDRGEVLAGNRDVRVEREDELVPTGGDVVIAFHEVTGGDVAEVRRAGLGGAGRVSVQRVGGNQMGDGAEFVAGCAPCVGECAMQRRVEREGVRCVGWRRG
jgi:hypothetical protein